MAIRGDGRDKVPVGCVFSGFEKGKREEEE
jgi:hypothetical protein